MGKAFQAAVNNGGVWAFSVNEVAYSAVCMNYGDDGFSSAEEAQTQVVCRTAGIIGGLSVNVMANAFTLATLTIISRKNGANGNQSVTVLAGTTVIFSDLVNTDSLASGDTYNVQITASALGLNTATLKSISMYFKATEAHSIQYAATNDGSPGVTASTQHFCCISGDLGGGTDENAEKQEFDVPGTARRLAAGVSQNTRSTSTVITLRINGANGNQSITIPAGTTGFFEDTTHSDAIAIGDDVCFGILTGSGGGTIGPRAVTFVFDSPTTNASNAFAATFGGEAKNAVQTLNSCIAGMISNTSASEAQVQQNPNFAFKCSNLKCYVTSNPFTASSTLKIRKNGSDGNQSVTIPAGTTGLFKDTTNQDSFSSTDKINAAWSGGTSGSGGTMRWLGLLINSGVEYTQDV